MKYILKPIKTIPYCAGKLIAVTGSMAVASCQFTTDKKFSLVSITGNCNYQATPITKHYQPLNI